MSDDILFFHKYKISYQKYLIIFSDILCESIMYKLKVKRVPVVPHLTHTLKYDFLNTSQWLFIEEQQYQSFVY
jgi:hypothetical protein